jgi:hypothetical protein
LQLLENDPGLWRGVLTYRLVAGIVIGLLFVSVSVRRIANAAEPDPAHQAANISDERAGAAIRQPTPNARMAISCAVGFVAWSWNIHCISLSAPGRHLQSRVDD